MDFNKQKFLIALALGIPSAILLYLSIRRVPRVVHSYYSSKNQKLILPKTIIFNPVARYPKPYDCLENLSSSARSLLCDDFLHSTLCDSTQKYLDQHFAHHPSGLLYVADGQLKGQGRTGDWSSEDGCLMFSFKFSCSTANILPLQLAIPVSIIQGIQKVSPKDLNLTGLLAKYPNDVFLNGKKLAGVLVNSVNKGKDFVLTVGIGINVRNQTTFASLEKSFPGIFKKETLLVSVLEEFYGIVKEIDQPQWPVMVVERFKELWMHLGEKVKMKDQSEWQVLDIDTSGFIFLKNHLGEVRKTMNRDDIIFL